jgi:hypothetical protein
MPGNGIIQAAVMCAAFSGDPSGCVGVSHPAAVLYSRPCAITEIASVSTGWSAGEWRKTPICWRPDGNRVRIIAGDQPVQWVEIDRGQAQCARVFCQPEINVQVRNHKGAK